MNLSKFLRVFFVLVLFSNNVLAYDESVDHLLEGTLIYSGSATSAAMVFDDDPSTYYSTSSSTFQWVGLDLGEPHVITRIDYMPTSGSQGSDRMLLSLFEGANTPNFMDAVPLYLISDPPSNGVLTRADVNVSRGFRYVRYVGGAGSYCNVAELKFYGHAGEGDDSHFYQITNLPTLSIHVKGNIMPTTKGIDYSSQSFLIYDNGTRIQDYPIQFRVRGNFSSTHENKAFRIKYDDGKSHHMMRGSANESPAKAKKWVLINSYRDKTLMRNPVAWAVSKRAERSWTPWNQIVDLVVNGDYRGTYTLADAVSVDSKRINITEMTENDIDEENITGGYLIELDNNYSQEPYHFKSWYGNNLSIHEPDEDVIQPEQFQYIQDTWNHMEDVAYSANFADKENGLPAYLDFESFFSWFLVSEFNGNTDMICQVFKYKERGDDHFYTGPIWDADLALENDITTYPANQRMDWTYKVRCSTGYWFEFLDRILSEPTFFAQLQAMWANLRMKGNFNPNDLADDVDSLREEVRASARLNFFRWPYLNQWLSLNPAVPGSWELEVDRVRNFVRDRVEWMDQMLYYGSLRQVNGVYQINSPADLCKFAEFVNGGETSANAALNADIDMKGYEGIFTPIGAAKKPYTGRFNGNGHTISHLNITGKNNVGLFGTVGSGAEVQNLNLDATCSVTGENYVGGFVGYMRTNKLTIKKCSTAATVTATGGYAAGFVGYALKQAYVYLQDSYNLGEIQADSMAAAMVAPSKGRLYITDCYNAGKVTGAVPGIEFAYTDYPGMLQLQNCYDVYSHQVEFVTPVEVKSGALCYLLNTGNGEELWYQNIDNGRKIDGHPVLNTTSGIVYNINGIYSNNIDIAGRYRFYKWEVLGINDGDSGTIQFGEFEILDENDVDYPSLSIYKGTESSIANRNWPNAGDNDITTKYCSSYSNSAYILFDAQTMVMPYGYRIYTANDTKTYPGRNPRTWRLYGSNTYSEDPNDDCWKLIDERINDTTLGATNFTPYEFTLATEDTETGERIIQNPRLEIQNEQVYDLVGRKVPGARSKGQEDSSLFTLPSSLKKGLYIVNGKKVLF